MKSILTLVILFLLTSCSNPKSQEYYYSDGVMIFVKGKLKKMPLVRKVIIQKDYVEIYQDKDTKSPYMILRIQTVDGFEKIYPE
jgi:hypothetical protein